MNNAHIYKLYPLTALYANESNLTSKFLPFHTYTQILTQLVTVLRNILFKTCIILKRELLM